MDEQELEKKVKPEELIRAEKLIDEGKNEEAFQLLNAFEEKAEHSLYDIVSCHLLECDLFFQQSFFEDVVKLAEQAYKESLGLGENFLSFDALMIMTHALIELHHLDKAFEIIKQGEKLLKTLTQGLSTTYKQKEANLAYLKGLYYSRQVETLDQALEFFKLSLALREEFGVKHEIATCYDDIARIFMLKGDLNSAVKYINQGLSLAKKSNKRIYIANCLRTYAGVKSFLGEMNHAIMLNKQSLAIYKDFNNRLGIARSLNNMAESYRVNGKLDQALESSKQSLELYLELGNLRELANIHDYLIQLLIEKGDLEQAKRFLHDYEQYSTELNDRGIKLDYLVSMALVLKASPRIRNWGKAEEILKQVLEDENLCYEITILALLNLCELLVIELRIIKDLEVLKELDFYLARLLDIAEQLHSFRILGESYLLQAKLALISLDLKKARQLLTKSQQIAEKYGLNLLAMKISNEHDELIEQLNIWENLRKSESSLEERIDLAQLDEQISSTVRKNIIKPEEFEVEQSVLLAVISKEGNLIFSNPFTADMTFDVNRIVDLLSSFNILSDNIFRESLDRVKFLDFTLLMKEVNSFIICYMFKGRTYGAHQKLSHFCDTLKSNIDIVKILNSSVKKTKPMTISDIPLIEELISESFLSDPQQFQVPFKAYEGEEPYLFVSYTHVDKLHVYPIIDYLNKMGINVWYDEGIPVSENWKKSIAESLEGCNTFLVFISPHILNSEMVKKEISFALKRKKKFVAVYLKETKLPIELEFEIADIQALMKYHMKESEFYAKLKKVLKYLSIK